MSLERFITSPFITDESSVLAARAQCDELLKLAAGGKVGMTPADLAEAAKGVPGLFQRAGSAVQGIPAMAEAAKSLPSTIAGQIKGLTSEAGKETVGLMQKAKPAWETLKGFAAQHKAPLLGAGGLGLAGYGAWQLGKKLLGRGEGSGGQHIYYR